MCACGLVLVNLSYTLGFLLLSKKKKGHTPDQWLLSVFNEKLPCQVFLVQLGCQGALFWLYLKHTKLAASTKAYC